MSKSELREHFKVLAKDFFAETNAAELAGIHRRIAEELSTHLRSLKNQFPRVAIYEPMRFELPISEIVAQVPELVGATLLKPVWDVENMWFAEKPDLVIVPGLFVDRTGNRLGRGKGYYDRYLAASVAHHVFLGYAFQLTEAVPIDSHDVKIGTIITH